MTDVQQDAGTHDAGDWTGRTVRTRDGAAVGTLGQVHTPNGNGGTWGEVRSKLGRRRLVPLDGATTDGTAGLTVPVDRASLRAAPRTGPGAPDAATETSLQRHYTGHGLLADAQARQHQRFGGAKIGAAFFGWLVAVGMTVLLGAVAAAVGAGLRLDPAGVDATTIGVTGAVVLLVVLALAYLAGGYVAGRLARFDGSRNGVLAWIVGVVVTIIAAVAGGVVGQNYDLFAQVRLPAVPVDPTALTVGGVIALVAALVVTLVAAAVGGRMGERFHRRVDREAAAAV